ncbi:tetratricopeptide repeat protein [Geomesophilobacter sediminis]|uniref:Tetratricopeptide repeat protein n=1 Tax=Geomesophilobacter sediminis TaxID=2798584 RepID=A0A8J7M1I6_9BACT|nr:tetratricopeptide repeat protein [Geomesophilobacter sediminis]MBJ6726763.1 tetratricopeptide repeat protein [Geomesophilobacter sediminis]
MASQKDKFLESAQRFALRGQIDRAIRDYQQVVALDPRDNRYRQKLAELLVRDGRKEEAIEQFEDIARNYAQNSYYLKAIAVYKQIQRLVPTDTHVSLTLAELNQKQGLVGNALAEYGQVVGALEREGNLKKVIEVLEQMISIDGQNLTTRLKYAETQRRVGENEAAYHTFSEILRTLRTRGDLAGAEKFEQRLNLMYPEKAKLTAAAAPLHRQQSDAALATAGGVAEAEPKQPAPHAELPISLEDDAAEPEPAAGTAAPVEFPGAAEGPELGLALEPEELPSEPVGAAESLPDFELPDFLQEELPSAVPSVAEAPAAAPVAISAAPEGISPEVERDAAETAAAPEPYWEVEIELDFDDAADEDDEAEAPLAPLADVSAGADARVATTPAPELPALTSLDEPAEVPIEEGLDWLDLVDLEAAGPVPVVSLEETAAPANSAAAVESAPAAKAPGAPVAPIPAVQAPGPDTAPAGGEPAALTWGDIFPEWSIPAADGDLAELQSHYDLGLAYREMGMYRDAIKELFQAGRNPRRRLDSLTFQALCYRDLGDNEKAEELLTQGRSLQGVSVEERMWLGYELADLFEQSGKTGAALELYQEVYTWDAGFQDVALRLGRLTGEEKIEEIEEIELEDEFSL